MDLARRITSRFLRLSVGIGVGGLLLYKTVPHGFPVTICQSAFGSTGQQVPQNCRNEFVERAKKMKLENAEHVSLFVNKGFSGFNAGSTNLPNGAVIGIPGWYLFHTGDHVINSPINFKGRTIKWESELGLQMKNALIPTQDNVAFTLGHEIAHLQLPQYKLLYAVLSPSWLYMTYKGLSSPKFGRFPILIDIVLKLCIVRLSYLAYKYVISEIQHQEEFLADEMSAKTDLSAAKGGVDFMEKRLQLNQVLRALHGINGLVYYDEQGNELKVKQHPKLTERLEKLQQILNEHLKQESLSNVNKKT